MGEFVKKVTPKFEIKGQELEDFIQIASHDLKAPLRKIMTFVNLLKQEGFGENSEEYLKRIDHNAVCMERLLNDLAGLFQVSAQETTCSSIDLREIVNAVVEDLKFEISELKAEIIIENLPVIEGSPVLIRQLFQNLIENAVKYHDKNRALRVHVGGQIVRQKHFLEIQVRDNGIGFGPEFAERIFLPFQRLHGKSQYEGSGMGLAICKKIVEQHGGTITAQGHPEQGSVFVVTLPMSQS